MPVFLQTLNSYIKMYYICTKTIMQRINLGKPYELYIKQMIDEGYFSTATELIRDALREKMFTPKRNIQLNTLIQEGITDFKEHKFEEFNDKLWDEIKVNAKKRIINNTSIPDYLKP